MRGGIVLSVSVIYDRVVAPAVLIALLVTGGFFAVRLRWFWLFRPRLALRLMRGGNADRGSTLRAVSLALAGTLGVGNIVGVALAILVGGAGSVFWMLLTALFAAGVKYAEVVLAVDTRVRRGNGWAGGAPFYMRVGGILGAVLPPLFSVLCLLCAVFEGCVIQANAVAESLGGLFSPPPVFWGVLMAVPACVVLLRGGKLPGAATARLIPFATVCYIVLCLSVIGAHLSALPAAVADIFSGAFRWEAGVGGVGGFLFSRAAKQGCSRGLLSNEAGCGTAPLAHVTANDTTPVRQGLWGVFEVFLDTGVICTLTALMLLSACPPPAAGTLPLTYLNAAVATLLGSLAPCITAPLILLFAFATVIGWSHYGISCLTAITRRPAARVLYILLLCLSLAWGAAIPVASAYLLTDLLLAAMTLINLPVLLARSARILSLTAREGVPVSRPPEPGAPAKSPGIGN